MNVFKSCRCPIIFLVIGGLAFIGIGIFGGWRGTSFSRNIRDSERDAEHSRQIGLIREFVGELDSGFATLENNLGTIKTGIGGGATDIRQLAIRLQSLTGVVEEMEDYIIYFRRRISGFMYGDSDTAICEIGGL